MLRVSLKRHSCGWWFFSEAEKLAAPLYTVEQFAVSWHFLSFLSDAPGCWKQKRGLSWRSWSPYRVKPSGSCWARAEKRHRSTGFTIKQAFFLFFFARIGSGKRGVIDCGYGFKAQRLFFSSLCEHQSVVNKWCCWFFFLLAQIRTFLIEGGSTQVCSHITYI